MFKTYAGGIAALLSACGAAAQSECMDFEAEAQSIAKFRITLEAPCEFEEGFGLAYASSSSVTVPRDCGSTTMCLDADADVFVDYGSAVVNSLGCNSNGVASASLSPQVLQTELFTRSGVIDDCTECRLFTTYSGSAAAVIVTEITCSWSGNFDIDLGATCTGGDAIGGLPISYVVSYNDANGNPAIDVVTSTCVTGSLPGCGSSQNTTVPLSGGPGPFIIGSFPFGPDGVWDYNEDGRTNLLDVGALTSDILAAPNGEIVLSGSSDRREAYDLDGDGLLTLADVNRMQGVLATLDQGVAGDDNGDLVTDCGDLAGVLAHQFDPALTICDPGYRIEFDVDLDGDNDVNDEAAILRIIQPADFNADGSLDFFDLSSFLDANSNMEPGGDFNGDGSYDFFDVSDFLDAFNNQECP